MTSRLRPKTMRESSDNKPNSKIDEIAEILFDFAVDRDDIKWSLGQLPEASSKSCYRVDYELQLLKIVVTGWSLSAHLADDPQKELLAHTFWNRILGFSKELSETTELMTGCDVDYFDLLKERLDDYVAVISGKEKGAEPAPLIGTRFAELCERPDDLSVSLAGSRMFNTIVLRAGKYLSDQGRFSALPNNEYAH